jgi:hypothetical protein
VVDLFTVGLLTVEGGKFEGDTLGLTRPTATVFI